MHPKQAKTIKRLYDFPRDEQLVATFLQWNATCLHDYYFKYRQQTLSTFWPHDTMK